MDKFQILRVLHILYLVLLLTFIYFYFAEYQPFKLHNRCAETSAKQVLAANTQMDPAIYYQTLYNVCISKSPSGVDN